MGDYSWVGPVAQAAGGIIGGAVRSGAAQGNEDLQREAYLRALKLLDSGELNYTPAQAGQLGPGAMNGVAADPAALMAERSALARLEQASNEGFNTIDRAAINRTISEANANERGQREAALARLDPNSGAALAARLSAQQTSANRANQQGLDIAAMSRKRALDALGQFGNMSSRMRQQGFQEDALRAQANDAISRFNAETSRFNADRQNDAARFGIGNKLNAMNIATGATGAYGNAMLNRGNTQAGALYGAGKGIAGAANAIGESNSGTKDPETGAVNYDTSVYDPEDPDTWGDED